MKKIMFLIFSFFIVIYSFPQNMSNASKKVKSNKNLKIELINSNNPTFVQMYYYNHNRVVEIVSAYVYFEFTSETGGTCSDFLSGKVHLWHHIAYNNTNFDTLVLIKNKQQFDVLNNYVNNLLSNKSSNSNGVFAGTRLEYIITIKDKQHIFKRRNYYSLYELLINNDTK